MLNLEIQMDISFYQISNGKHTNMNLIIIINIIVTE